MRIRTHIALVVLAIAVSACGKAEEAGTDAPALKAGGAPSAAAAADPARDYIAQFIVRDPDQCFREVTQRGAVLEPGLVGVRTVPTRVVVAIDGSGSMAGRIGGQSKLDLAREAARQFIEGLPTSAQTALLVFGQQGDNSPAGKARSCAGVDVLAPMSADRGALSAAVRQVRAVGWTPLAAGLERAQSLFAASSTPGEQVIYVVSDGEETCGGDPAAAARRINAGPTRAIVNIIGFGLPSKAASALKAVSDAGGGGFVNVGDRAGFDRTLERVRESNRQAANMVRASDAIAGNAVRTADSVGRAMVCVSDIMSDESLRMSDDLDKRSAQGGSATFARQALDRLKERHDALQARMDAFKARLEGDEAKARGRIEADANAVR